MKKFKKLLAGLLAGAMMLGSMTATAFAEGETSSPTPAQVTIDSTKSGSLTIHKYEYNGTAGKKATGAATDTVPEGAKALAGAEFTIYEVANVDDMTAYYNTNPTSLPIVDSYLSADKKTISESYVGTKVGAATTNDEGLATFTGLDLGFYVVIETKSPDKVTTPVTPFLVSIPMTTADGTSWLYDVHVFPKNKTTYGGVTLEKKGTGGTPLSGVTFVLQKQNGESWTGVTNREDNNEAFNLKTDENGKINVDGLSQGTYRFIETNRGDNNFGYIMDGVTTYEFTVNSEGKIEYGGETEANATIQITNEKPDITKEVKDRSTEDWKHATDYNVGDFVPYQITIKVPSNITKLKAFKITDTPTNLKDKTDTINLKCESSDVAAAAYTVGQGTGENGFTITFVPAQMAAYAGKTIVVTYSAELLSGAATTTAGNSNSAKLEYSNKILPETVDPDNPNRPDPEPGKDTIEDKTVVYTFKFEIVKKADSATGDGLIGVEFDLYKEVTEGTDGAASADVIKAAGLDTSKTWKKISTLTTGEGGVVSQSGLANGTYYLVETKTAKGYNLLKAPVEVKLNIAYTTTTTQTFVTVEGVKKLVKSEVTNTEFKEGTLTSDGTHTETIINKKGFTLPTTGGMGTVIFSVLGIALVLAGLLVITASRKKAAK